MANWETPTFMLLQETGKINGTVLKFVCLFFPEILSTFAFLPMQKSVNNRWLSFSSSSIHPSLKWFCLNLNVCAHLCGGLWCSVSALWPCVCTFKCQVCSSNRRPAAEARNHRTKPGATVQTCLSLTAGSFPVWSLVCAALRGVPNEQISTTLKSSSPCSPIPELFRTVAWEAVCLSGRTSRLVFEYPHSLCQPLIHHSILQSIRALDKPQ